MLGGLALSKSLAFAGEIEQDEHPSGSQVSISPYGCLVTGNLAIDAHNKVVDINYTNLAKLRPFKLTSGKQLCNNPEKECALSMALKASFMVCSEGLKIKISSV